MDERIHTETNLLLKWKWSKNRIKAQDLWRLSLKPQPATYRVFASILFFFFMDSSRIKFLIMLLLFHYDTYYMCLLSVALEWIRALFWPPYSCDSLYDSNKVWRKNSRGIKKKGKRSSGYSGMVCIMAAWRAGTSFWQHYLFHITWLLCARACKVLKYSYIISMLTLCHAHDCILMRLVGIIGPLLMSEILIKSHFSKHWR